MFVLFLIIVASINTNHNKTVIVTADNDAQTVISDNEIVEPINNKNKTPDEEKKPDTSKVTVPANNKIKFTVLGEMMMGGSVTINNSYLYNTAFKKISNITRDSDFTYTTLSTNITTFDKIEDAKSKYLVTKEITSAITTLGIDVVNVASDHMIDFSKNIFENTLSIIKKNNTYIAGINNSILYLEKDSKKIAIVAANNVFLGIKNDYTDYGINAYSENKMKSDIVTASQNADIVIVDIHWGREYIFGVTDEMRRIAYSAIDNGADIVMGSHALGIYPIITYKNVPIIYSTGYIMTDSSSELAKQSYIFDININAENKIKSIEMLPIYIKDQKEVMPYHEYNKEFATKFINQLNTWNQGNALNSKIVDNKIIVTF